MSTPQHFLVKAIEKVVLEAKATGKSKPFALDRARKEKKFQAEATSLTDEQKQNIPSDVRVTEIVEAIYGSTNNPHRKIFLKSSKDMNHVPEERIAWAVANVLLMGALNLFIGDPDIGKTLMVVYYIANLSRQGKKTVVICREDSYSMVWKPRLRAAGADLSFVVPVHDVVVEIDGQEESFPWMLDNPEHLALLQDKLLEEQPELCVIDPLGDFAGKKNLNESGDVRSITGPLNKIAQTVKVAILANCHTTKAIVDSVIKTAAGSYQLMAAVAVAWYFMEDPDNSERRLMMQARNKYGTKLGWRYTIKAVDGVGVAEITGKEYRNVNEMLKAKLDRDDSKTGAIRKWLDTLQLENGPRDAAACNREAFDRGFDRDLVTRACQQRHVKRDKKNWWIEKAKEQQPRQEEFDKEQQQ